MLTISKILAKSPENWLNNASSCVVSNYKKIVDSEDGNPVVLAIIYSTLDSKGNPKTNPVKHKCYIKGLNGKNKKIVESKVEVSCDCEAFLYWSEVALYKKDASPIFFSNGADAVVRNPKHVPFMCKHTITLGKMIHRRRM